MPGNQARSRPYAEQRRAPVMADVARLAGVSHQTVSRVLNDHPNVRPGTKARVLSAIRELDYRPNIAARTLVTKRTKTLGVVSFGTTLYGPASMLYGIEQAAKQEGYFVIVAALTALDRTSVLGAVRRLRDQAVEGVIVIASQATVVNALKTVPGDIPLVAVGCGANATLASVAVDNEGGAAKATGYLLDLGHATVHHVGGPRSWLDAQDRERGWERTLRTRGAEVPNLNIRGNWSAKSGYELGRRIAEDPGITAVFCTNDHMALGLLRAVAEAGRRVPEQLSIVGFDDIPEAGYFSAPLTTVRQDFDHLGRSALRTLIGLIKEDPGPHDRPIPRVVIEPRLVPRSSAAAPPHD